MTVKEYLDSREKLLSKKKFDKLARTLDGVDVDTEVRWAYFPGKSTKVDEDSGKPSTIDVISTMGVDRDNEVLLPDGCDLKEYAKTPTVLFGHNCNSIPVGVSKWQKVDGDKILSKTEYFTSQFAMDVFEAAVGGALANSVGFIPTKYLFPEDKEYASTKEKYGISGDPSAIFTKWRLLEYSKVPVPANAEAITMAMKSAKSDTMKEFLQTELEEILKDTDNTPDKTVEPIDTIPNTEIDGTTADTEPQVDNIDDKTVEPDNEGLTKPEKEVDDVVIEPAEDTEDGTDKTSIVDMVSDFCEDNNLVLVGKDLQEGYEEYRKSGAVLSKKNKDALRQAADLINSVLDSADIVPDEGDDEKTATVEGKETVEDSAKNAQTEPETVTVVPETVTPEEIEGLDENPKPDILTNEQVSEIIKSVSTMFDDKINRKIYGKV